MRLRQRQEGDEGGGNQAEHRPCEGKEILSPLLFPFFCRNSRPSCPEEPEEAAESRSPSGRFQIPPGGSRLLEAGHRLRIFLF